MPKSGHSMNPKPEQYLDHLQAISYSTGNSQKSFRIALASAIWLTLGALWLPGFGSFGPVIDLSQSEMDKPEPVHVILRAKPIEPVQRVQRQVSQAKKVPLPQHLVDPSVQNVAVLDMDVEPVFEDDFALSMEMIPDGPPEPPELVYSSQATGIVPPNITHRAMPRYPPRAIPLRIQGYVMIQAILGKDGEIRDIQVLRGLAKGKFGFEKSAIAALKKWEFEPGTLSGKPVDIRMNLRLTFALQ